MRSYVSEGARAGYTAWHVAIVKKNALEYGLYFTFSLHLYVRAGIQFDSLHTTLDVFTHLFPVAFEWDLTSPKSVWRINKPNGCSERLRLV